nr:hypothetical protein [uncultured Mediterranean phage uvMED]
MKKMVGNEVVEMTKDEETEFLNIQKQVQEDTKKEKEENAKEELNRKNSFTKFVAMGLTEDEATTITGYKPPEEETS